jgi:hypothetical protein
MRAQHGWAALITGVTAWEGAALRRDPDALLSRGIDRARARHPALNAACTLAVLVTALHLIRWLPASVDPFRIAS